MDKAMKSVLTTQLKCEGDTLKELEQIFKRARIEVKEKICDLNARSDMQNLQSIIYQKKYQKAILDQIDEALTNLQSGQYKTVEQYLTDSYDNGYIGMMYSLQSQGIPITMPIDQRKVVNALTTESKLSSSYYKANPLKGRLEENVDLLKDRIRSNLSRGIVSGKSWLDVAVDIASGMNNPFDKAMHDAMRIVRTEGHRVNQQGFLDAGDIAKEKGADIVKQWDATMDRKTRPAHQQADGQIVEWDDFFLVGGEKMKAPSIGGSAKNVCNCRCQLLQRARWALDEDELEELQKRAEFFGLDKSESFEDFKQKYLKLPAEADTMKLNSPISVETCSSFGDLKKYFKDSYDIDIDDDVTKLNFEKVKSAMDGVDATIKRYPQLSKQINRFGTYDAGMMCTDGKRIYFNPKSFNYVDDASGLRYAYFAGSHEAGHCVDMILCQVKSLKEDFAPTANLGLYDNKVYQNAKWNYWDKNSISRGIVTKAINNVKKEHPELKNKTAQYFRGSISNYSLESTAETVAEAVAQVLTFEKYPKKGTIQSKFDLAEEIVKIIDERMNGIE